MDDIARILGLPPEIQITRSAIRHVNRLIEGESRSTFIRHARMLFDYFNPWPADGITERAFIDFLVQANFAPGTTLSLLTNARVLLAELNHPLPASIAIRNLEKRLTTVRNDGRIVAIAIGECKAATVITADQLVPNPEASLRDATEDLAIRAMASLGTRPQEGVTIRMDRIRPAKAGYFVEQPTKTTTRSMFIKGDLVIASNRVAQFIPDRHKLGVDVDALLPNAQGYFIPALDNKGRFRGHKKHFERHWFGRILKKRTKEFCTRAKLSRSQTNAILSRISGKSGRRGAATDNVFLNLSLTECSARTHHESSHMVALYSEGMDVAASQLAEFLLSRPAAARERMNSQC